MGTDDIGRIEHELALLGRQPNAGSMSPRRNPDAPLERSAYLLLSKLDEAGPMTIRSIADAFALDDSTVNRQTAAAVRSGLLERIADPDGGIARKFTITAAGRYELERYREWSTAGLGRVLADWPEGDVAALADLLVRLNESITARVVAMRDQAG